MLHRQVPPAGSACHVNPEVLMDGGAEQLQRGVCWKWPSLLDLARMTSGGEGRGRGGEVKAQ